MDYIKFLNSLSESERIFISKLDYSDNHTKHKEELDKVIFNDGLVNFHEQGCWYPYEVIELGKNVLIEGHEREFAACILIVLVNIYSGNDRTNDIDGLIESYIAHKNNLSPDLIDLIDTMIKKRTDNI